MAKVILLKGLPASGKTTWAKEYMKTHPNTKRVNKDDLRAMIDDGVWDGKREKFILQIRDDIIVNALKKGFDIIVDDTNFSQKHETRIKAITPKDTEIVINDEFLNVSLVECLQRDKGREHPVGKEVIQGMYNQFISKSSMTREEKSDLWFQSFVDKKIDYIPYDVTLDDVIIVDIDGTVALMNGRSPFDYTQVSSDLPHKPVIELIEFIALNDYAEIIFVSGREGTDQVQEDTRKWINSHVITYKEIYMRKQGDYRKDAIIKKEIYEEHIKGKYNVLFVLDDRDQTVKQWRELRLPTFQVAEGNF